MYRAPFRPLCVILLATVLGTQACKTAPQTPEFSETADAAAELAELEAERAEILEAQKQLDADLKLAEAGWPAGKAPPKVEASYTSKGGKYDDDEIVEIKTEIKKCTEKNDQKGAQSWFKKLFAKCQTRKQELTKVLVEVEVKIDTRKKEIPDYGDIIPKKPPVVEKPADKDNPPKYEPPADKVPKLPPGTGVDIPDVDDGGKGKGDPGQSK